MAVSTPPKEDGSADLSYILSASKELAKNINGYKVIVTKSTVPVGTTNKIKEVISELTDESFDVASNPEFFARSINFFANLTELLWLIPISAIKKGFFKLVLFKFTENLLNI